MAAFGLISCTENPIAGQLLEDVTATASLSFLSFWQRIMALLEDHSQRCNLDLQQQEVVPLSPVLDFVRDTFAADLHQHLALVQHILQGWIYR